MLVVFTGPSLAPDAVRRALPRARVAAPAARGDVAQAVADGASAILLIDGTFAHRLAVPPSELVQAIGSGVAVIGTASMGAIRAAECAPAGMTGVGAVAALFRFGILRDDDEVAVAVEPDREHRASSVALVNVRFAALAALRSGLLDRRGAARLLGAARALHFSERQWPSMVGAGADPALLALCHATDVKRRDAQRAVALVGALPDAPPTPRQRPVPAPRYPGHDPWFGQAPSALAPELFRWLAATGRARRLWPQGAPGGPAMAWADLEARHELAIELMRLHAARTAAQLGGGEQPLGEHLDRARGELARAHGFDCWEALQGAGGPSGVPLAWVSAAAHRLALARRNLQAAAGSATGR